MMSTAEHVQAWAFRGTFQTASNALVPPQPRLVCMKFLNHLSKRKRQNWLYICLPMSFALPFLRVDATKRDFRETWSALRFSWFPSLAHQDRVFPLFLLTANFTSFTSFAADLFTGVANAFAFVWLWFAYATDAGGNLTNQLLIDAADADFGRFAGRVNSIDGKRDAIGWLNLNGVRVA